MSNPRRMHPIAGFLRFLKQLKEMIIPIIVFFFIGKGESGLINTLYLIGLGVVIVGLLVTGILHWYRFTYRVEDGELRIEYGVFVRKRRFIPIERIQTIDVTAGIIQRIFGLVKLQVETAGGGKEAEVELTAIKEAEANELRAILTKIPKAPEVLEPEEENKQKPTYQITMKELLVLASTSGGIGFVISAIFAFLSQFAEYVPFEKAFNKVEQYINLSILTYIITLVILFLLISWIIGVLIMALRYANFKVVKRDDELFITRGLIEKRQSTIPLHRIQAIRFTENLIRQPLGYATVLIESAGGSLDKGEELSTVLFPLIKKNQVEQLLKHFVPEYKLSDEINHVPKRSLGRYILKAVIPVIPVIIAVSYFFNPWGYLSLLLLPLTCLLGYLRFRDAGWRIDGEQLTLRFRFIGSKITLLQQKKRIQSFDMKQSSFQRTKKLTSVKTFIKSSVSGKGFQVTDVEDSDGWTMFEWYITKKKES
ncbi:PH domain-containing protein [Ferdinandcohnia quinoae]|uniref:PH domain-containing protein n=1 Tax=Fredinandcohnia quinoae TaxID=2918902 RepID=A0AAW5EDN0_9BACI|nr:PH domain-containing protein [Fredinandcohnia sp. SECRCQ15]MCH1627258.1 PH domain-containing protein [Fredinandcohnia sp. SECRCQ15]